MPRVSASALSMLPLCVYPFKDDAIKPAEDKQSPKARKGSAIHRCNEWALAGKKYTPEAAIAEFRVPPADHSFVFKGHEKWLEWWRSTGNKPFRSEVPVEYSTTRRTGRIIPDDDMKGVRGYPYRPGCAYGTADLLLYEHPTLWVLDVKTGNPKYVEKASVNHQLRLLAMTLLKVFPMAESIRTTVQFVDEYAVTNDEHITDGLDLDVFESWLCKRYAQIGTCGPTRGEHCHDKWCKWRPQKEFAGCPAWTEGKEVAA